MARAEGERVISDTIVAVGMLALPPEERNECMAAEQVVGPVITLHDHHVCRKPNKHHEPHRCWTCTFVWPTT